MVSLILMVKVNRIQQVHEYFMRLGLGQKMTHQRTEEKINKYMVSAFKI